MRSSLGTEILTSPQEPILRITNLEPSVRRTRSLAFACGLAGTATLAAALAAPAAFAAESQTGSAFAVSVNAKLLNALAVNVGPLPKAAYPAGQDKSVVKIDGNKILPGAGHAKLLNAASELKAGVLTSSASIADVDILGLVKAKLVTSTCVSDGKTVTGDSKLVDVWVHGQKIDIALTGKISVTDAITVHINEKVASGNTLTVNALRVSVGGDVAGIKVGDLAQAEVILSQAKCTGPGTVVTEPGTGGPGTTPSTPPSSTPGGSVTATPSPTSSAVWPPASTTTSASAVPGDGSGVTPVANTDNLAQTGVNAVIPLAIGGFVLVAGGAGAVWMVRRKRGMQG